LFFLKEKKGQEASKSPDYEVQKLDKILILVRDPDEMRKRKDEQSASK
jgi:hypothetical protein